MTVLSVLLFLFLLFFGVLYGVYRYIFYSPDKTQNDDYTLAEGSHSDQKRRQICAMIDAVRAIPYEKVTIRSHDGLTLCGRYYHQKDGAPLDICFHGYRGTPARDFSGGTQIILREGHNALMIEERAQCTSEGHTITFGVEERFDCLAWVQYALARFGPDTRILLVGISMGAATVLMASELALPAQVVGIIADCPYTSPLAIIRKVSGGMGLPPKLSGLLAIAAARVFGHFDLTAANAAEAVKHAKLPILLIHGEADPFVPCGMSREIRDASPAQIRLHTFPGAGHGLSYLVDPARYEALIRDFSKEALEEKELSSCV